MVQWKKSSTKVVESIYGLPHGGKGCSRGVGKGFGPSLASLGKLFKRLGEACESLVAIDEDTAECRNLQWARILTRIKGKLPSSL